MNASRMPHFVEKMPAVLISPAVLSVTVCQDFLEIPIWVVKVIKFFIDIFYFSNILISRY